MEPPLLFLKKKEAKKLTLKKSFSIENDFFAKNSKKIFHVMKFYVKFLLTCADTYNKQGKAKNKTKKQKNKRRLFYEEKS